MFPDVNEVIAEDKTFKEKIGKLDELLQEIGEDKEDEVEKVFEFEFFTGGRNEKFDRYIRNFGLSTENLRFLDFLQSHSCKEILETNYLKIRIETVNIYFKNDDKNKSIFEFLKNQQNKAKGKINFDFVFDRNHKSYWRWILNGFNAVDEVKFDVLKFKNTKFLLYRFNDVLSQSDQKIIPFIHSVVTDDYLAAEHIQNQNWHYFVEEFLHICKKKKEISQPLQKGTEFLLNTSEHVTIAKESYKTYYNRIERNLLLTIEKLSADDYNKIKDNF